MDIPHVSWEPLSSSLLLLKALLDSPLWFSLEGLSLCCVSRTKMCPDLLSQVNCGASETESSPGVGESQLTWWGWSG